MYLTTTVIPNRPPHVYLGGSGDDIPVIAFNDSDNRLETPAVSVQLGDAPDSIEWLRETATRLVALAEEIETQAAGTEPSRGPDICASTPSAARPPASPAPAPTRTSPNIWRGATWRGVGDV